MRPRPQFVEQMKVNFSKPMQENSFHSCTETIVLHITDIPIIVDLKPQIVSMYSKLLLKCELFSFCAYELKKINY